MQKVRVPLIHTRKTDSFAICSGTCVCDYFFKGGMGPPKRSGLRGSQGGKFI